MAQIIRRQLPDRPPGIRQTSPAMTTQVRPSAPARKSSPLWPAFVLVGVLGILGYYGMQKTGIKYVGRGRA